MERILGPFEHAGLRGFPTSVERQPSASAIDSGQGRTTVDAHGHSPTSPPKRRVVGSNPTGSANETHLGLFNAPGAIVKVFLIYVRDEDYYQLLPLELGGGEVDGRVKVMAFPPIGIETLAPVVREHGHEVRMFDTCHPRMREADIAEATAEERPDVIALSFLSTTSYPATCSMARRLKETAPNIRSSSAACTRR